MTTGFVNKRSILFGIDTHVADLTGSLALAETLDSGQQERDGSTQGGQQAIRANLGLAGRAIFTFANITTPAVSNLIIVVTSSTFIANSNASKDWFLKRGTTIIDDFSLPIADTNSNDVNLRIFIDENPPAGIFTYTLEEVDGNTYAGMAAQLFFIAATDTHVATLNGANTQRVTDEDVLS